ncbi:MULTISPECIES: glycosyltransferase [unclassified Microbacterium]|uniref:glycosyltransferase n=1 Tax=unclassified Microbacterium TaxID=2609290 RepID=UPI000CFB5BC2|nr:MULTISPECIES: glycosyltransferase [unclassified Microbacterium]PQZ56344.1 glycosyl transferase [Microbacterium sp. MYb43]PQZ79331.1 glycosyl transferase [Microbacterium sp. MYb40]PRB19899.1 glycosyl transferase [Microbacterium sp. MYb54]PRB26889.1 glycosyl transferase [Microbacterium sp. MYb50]PRB66015.1 glycosyl transferase [Microbacterium sp. MYb24]
MAYVLQNVVFPGGGDPDVLPLYVDLDSWPVTDDAPARDAGHLRSEDILGRHAARIPAGGAVSLGTYFNGFPAAYWQHWTSVRNVDLTVRSTGPATIRVHRSNSGGVSQQVATRQVDGAATTTFELELAHYDDGGWIWFDVIAGDAPAVLEGGEWTTAQAPVRTGRASLGITTFDKPDYCVETLRTLAASPEVMSLVDRIFVVDQGSSLVTAHEGYEAVAERLGDALEVIRQDNLGGSGGFARAMQEALRRPESEFVQLLDDDVRLEPESLRRSIVFAQYSTEPLLVGGHMFDLLQRCTLHGWAEVVDEVPFAWGDRHPDEMPHDFAVDSLRRSPLLHERMDADYNGWWMCLIPLQAIRTVGLALPAFIKWDDAEFCLRAGEAGFPTVSMPGVALWHVSWVNKDDMIDWQAYFHARNRIVAALLHSNAPRGGRLLVHSRRVDLKHLMMMQYYPVALRAKALQDVLSGPTHLQRDLATSMPAARALASDFPETVVHRDDSTIRSRTGRRLYAQAPSSPTGMRLRWLTLSTLVSNWVRRPASENVARPEAEFRKNDALWWRLGAVDSALVDTADSSGKNLYIRDRQKHRRMLRESARLHAELRRRWPELQKHYRDALPELVSPSSWQQIFEEKA